MNSHAIIRRIAALLIATLTGSLFASCHTAAGLGRDVQHAGQGINRAANRAHN